MATDLEAFGLYWFMCKHDDFLHFSEPRLEEHGLLIKRFSSSTSHGWVTNANCPAHQDSDLSLAIELDRDTGNVRMECREGCSIKAICDCVGILPSRMQNARAAEIPVVPPETILHFARQIGRLSRTATYRLRKRGVPVRVKKLAILAEKLELEEKSLVAMGVCWLAEYKAYAFPERDGHGEVCGMVLGFEDGRMASFEGARRGLSLPIGWRERPGPLYICDGLLDTAAATKMGYRAIGRPPIGDVIADLVTLLCTVPGDIAVVAGFDQQGPQLNDSRDLAAECRTALATQRDRPRTS